MTNREICERLIEIRDYTDLALDNGLSSQTRYDMLEQISADLRHLLLDIVGSEKVTTTPFPKDFPNTPNMNPINGSPDDLIPDGNGGWRRRGDENIIYTYGTETTDGYLEHIMRKEREMRERDEAGGAK